MIFFFERFVDVINHVRGADGRRKELKNMEQSLLNNHVLMGPMENFFFYLSIYLWIII